MSNVLRFTHKSILTTIILMMVTSGTFTASAQVNAATGRNSLAARLQNRPLAANPATLGTNLLQDPSFDASYGSTQYWGQLPTPPDTICIWWGAGCSINGAGYRSGGGWACFGCLQSSYNDVYQYVTFPKCGAQLEFYLYIGEYFGPGAGWGMDNHFGAYIDGIEVFSALGSHADSYLTYPLVSIDVSQFADGGVHLVEFYSDNYENFLWFNLDDVALYPIIPPSSGCAEVAVKFAGTTQGTYGIPGNTGERLSYPVNDGPVFVNSSNGVKFVASERVAYFNGSAWTSFSELMGLPQNLVSTKYSFPAYDNLNFNSQLRFGNVSGATATVRVYIGGVEMTSGGIPSSSPYTLAPGASLRVSYVSPNGVPVNGGPVVIQSSGGNIVAALRVVPNIYNGSFSEIMGVPQNQVGTTYLFPWYNNTSLNTQVRIGNVSGSTASVRFYIGVNEMTSGCTTVPSKLYPYTLAAGTSVRVSCPGVNNGPVKIVSTGNIVASERVAFLVGNTGINFSELMGLPSAQLTTSYIFPWYNNASLDTQLRFGNVSGSSATVHVYIGGQEMASGCLADGQPSNSPYTIAAGASLRVSCAGVNNGPVKIVSNRNIVAAERVVINNGSAGIGFSELMGLPESQLTTGYILPWYNNLSLNTQLRVGVP